MNRNMIYSDRLAEVREGFEVVRSDLGLSRQMVINHCAPKDGWKSRQRMPNCTVSKS